MLIFPAIDLKDGQCVRLYQGRMDESTVYSDDPVRMAMKWSGQGARWLHVVDLDGAVSGASANLDAVGAIAEAVSIDIQLGGGIRDMEALERVFDAGINRAVLGTSFVIDQDFAAHAIERYRERIAVGLDAKNGKVAIRGWVDITEISLFEAAKTAQDLGAKTLICTDISTDGAMTGPNIETYVKLLDALNISIIASGGISSLNDIVNLKKATENRLEGVIIGRAIYEETFSVADAIRVGESIVD